MTAATVQTGKNWPYTCAHAQKHTHTKYNTGPYGEGTASRVGTHHGNGEWNKNGYCLGVD